jgi:hypothetical protein
MKYFFFILSLAPCCTRLFAQSPAHVRMLCVLNIKGYLDVYLITAVDVDHKDTLRIISEINDLNGIGNYEQIKKGNTYLFKVKGALADESPFSEYKIVAVGAREKLFWTIKDGYKSVPYNVQNMNGLYIIKDYVPNYRFLLPVFWSVI